MHTCCKWTKAANNITVHLPRHCPLCLMLWLPGATTINYSPDSFRIITVFLQNMFILLFNFFQWLPTLEDEDSTISPNPMISIIYAHTSHSLSSQHGHNLTTLHSIFALTWLCKCYSHLSHRAQLCYEYFSFLVQFFPWVNNCLFPLLAWFL